MKFLTRGLSRSLRGSHNYASHQSVMPIGKIFRIRPRSGSIDRGYAATKEYSGSTRNFMAAARLAMFPRSLRQRSRADRRSARKTLG